MSSAKACIPYIGMVLVQLAYAGSNILCKLALQQGLSFLVFIIYRHLIAAVFLAPLAFVLERKQRPQLSFSTATKIFVLALFGVTISQNVYYAGLIYTSATVACDLSNVIPALTFVVAIMLRMEKISIKSAKGKARLLGTVLCISGALIFSLWKGHLLGNYVKRPLVELVVEGASYGKENWLKGSLLILASHVAFSAWLVLQAMVSEIYPAKLSMNTLLCFFAFLQSSVLGLIFERKTSSWKLNSNIQLLATIYSTIAISCFSYYLQTFCISTKGPVFAAMFTPLLMVIVGIFSYFFLSEQLHVGSLIGASTIISGLYIVLWGKSSSTESSHNEEGETEKALENVDPSPRDIKISNNV